MWETARLVIRHNWFIYMLREKGREKEGREGGRRTHTHT